MRGKASVGGKREEAMARRPKRREMPISPLCERKGRMCRGGGRANGLSIPFVSRAVVFWRMGLGVRATYLAARWPVERSYKS